MIDKSETYRVLQEFADFVVDESKKNLSSGGVNASGDLSRSIDSFVKINDNSIDVDILMNEYGKFIDRGVKGIKSGRSLSGFAYKNKKPPVRFLQTWLKQKTGKFRQRNQRSIAFAIQNKIFKEGIKPTKFLTTPFEQAFGSLPDDVVEAYGLDLVQFMNFTLKTDDI